MTRFLAAMQQVLIGLIIVSLVLSSAAVWFAYRTGDDVLLRDIGVQLLWTLAAVVSAVFTGRVLNSQSRRDG